MQVDEPSRGSLGSLASPALDRRPGSVDPVQRHQLMAAFQAAAQRSSDQVCAYMPSVPLSTALGIMHCLDQSAAASKMWSLWIETDSCHTLQQQSQFQHVSEV